MSEIYIKGKPVSALRVVDLKEELEKRGLSKSGKKDELVLRLQSFLEVNPEDTENGGADGEEEDVIEAERRAAEERRKLEEQREEQRRQEEEKKREEERLKEEELRKEQELREIKEKEAEQQKMAEQKRLEEEARKELIAETQRKEKEEKEEKERAREKAAEEERKRKEEEKERRRKEEEEQKQKEKEEKRRREKERQDREEEEERKRREKVKQELDEQKEKEKRRREKEKREEEEDRQKEKERSEQKEKEKERKRLESEQKEKERLKRKAEEERREEEEREEKKQKLSAKTHQNGTENENKEQRLKEELLKRLREQKEEKEKREEEKKKKTEEDEVHADTTLQLEIDSTDLVSEEPAKEKTPPRQLEVSAGQVTSLRRIGNRGPDSEKSRKRGWGASRRLSSTENIDISSNLLKDLVPDAANLLSKDVAIHEEEKENGHNSDIEEDDDEIGPSLPKDKLETIKEKVIRKKIRLEDDPEESPLIVVHNLTRPFTVMQLKNMLNRTGTVEDFWINKVKSKCCVKYTSVGQASETRMALNGITWPMDNKTPLAVYYTTEEQLERFKSSPEDPVRIVTSNGTAARGLRDWDKEKVERTERRRERSEEVEKKPSQPVKSLEELFNKTKTTPALYWKPLSEETIKRKEEARNKRMLAAINKKKSKSRSKS